MSELVNSDVQDVSKWTNELMFCGTIITFLPMSFEVKWLYFDGWYCKFYWIFCDQKNSLALASSHISSCSGCRWKLTAGSPSES